MFQAMGHEAPNQRARCFQGHLQEALIVLVLSNEVGEMREMLVKRLKEAGRIAAEGHAVIASPGEESPFGTIGRDRENGHDNQSRRAGAT
jgi:hypothetical protein